MADDADELQHGAKRQPGAGMEAPPAQLMHRKTVAVGSAPVRGLVMVRPMQSPHSRSKSKASVRLD